MSEVRIAKTFSELLKFNPYHDRLGRFATADGYATFTIRTKDPKKQHMADMAIAREKERAAAGASAKPKDENAFTPAKTKAEAMDYAKNKLGIGYADYGNIDIDTINHINQEITELQKKYPELKEAVSNIAPDNRKGVYAAAGTGYSGKNTLYIGQGHYGKGIEHLKECYQNDVDSGYHPQNTDYKSIIWHEYGHLLAYQHYKTDMGFKAKDSLGYYDGMEYAKKVRGRSFEKAVVRDAAKSLKITQKELKSRISRYAEKNPAETFAEAFAEFNNSPNPRPECIAMMKAAGILK